MKTQGHPELNEKAKITKGYNLSSKYIIHSVGPIIENKITKVNESDLFNCYQSCLKLADKYQLKSIAFCSISTGIYGCPIKGASKIALKSIKQFFIENTKSSIQKVIIDVFSKGDYDVYKKEIENNAIILGTGTGLSSAAGFEYGGKNLYKRLYALVQ